MEILSSTYLLMIVIYCVNGALVYIGNELKLRNNQYINTGSMFGIAIYKVYLPTPGIATHFKLYLHKDAFRRKQTNRCLLLQIWENLPRESPAYYLRHEQNECFDNMYDTEVTLNILQGFPIKENYVLGWTCAPGLGQSSECALSLDTNVPNEITFINTAVDKPGIDASQPLYFTIKANQEPSIGILVDDLQPVPTTFTPTTLLLTTIPETTESPTTIPETTESPTTIPETTESPTTLIETTETPTTLIETTEVSTWPNIETTAEPDSPRSFCWWCILLAILLLIIILLLILLICYVKDLHKRQIQPLVIEFPGYMGRTGDLYTTNPPNYESHTDFDENALKQYSMKREVNKKPGFVVPPILSGKLDRKVHVFPDYDDDFPQLLKAPKFPKLIFNEDVKDYKERVLEEVVKEIKHGEQETDNHTLKYYSEKHSSMVKKSITIDANNNDETIKENIEKSNINAIRNTKFGGNTMDSQKANTMVIDGSKRKLDNADIEKETEYFDDAELTWDQIKVNESITADDKHVVGNSNSVKGSNNVSDEFFERNLNISTTSTDIHGPAQRLPRDNISQKTVTGIGHSNHNDEREKGRDESKHLTHSLRNRDEFYCDDKNAIDNSNDSDMSDCRESRREKSRMYVGVSEDADDVFTNVDDIDIHFTMNFKIKSAKRRFNMDA